MTSLTKRRFLAGAATAAAAAVAQFSGSMPARGAAPQIGRQAPGWYRYMVGDIEVTVVTDGTLSFPLTDSYVINAPLEEVRNALEAIYLPKDRMTQYYSPIVVNTGSKLVVIDTGSGPEAFAESNGGVGQFAANLAAAGIDAKAVDAVVISHCHVDHVSGLLDVNKKLAFPNAEVLVPAVEWKFWMDDGEMGRAPKGRMEGVFKMNRGVFDALGRKVTPYDWNKELAPGLTPVATVGHSIGHTSFVIASGSSQVFVQSDVTNHPGVFARHPGWSALFDQDPVQAVATRRKVYDMLVADRMLVQGYHYPFPGLAHVEKTATGYREIPVAWNPVI
jgi:glyoxylase-like metal-dependent hydrolase (beta-lactamase superfamily II)